MKGKTRYFGFLAGVVVFVCSCGIAFAHCDTLEGPVVKDAKTALEKKDVTPVLKWVKKENEPKIRAAFDKATAERTKNPQAKDRVDMEFFETLIRIHREGEGAEYSGIKPAGTKLEPPIVEADAALETGSCDKLVKMVNSHIAEGIKERFERALEKKKHVDESVEKGREYVEAYVEYVHYIESLHNAASAEGGHHGEGKHHEE